LAINHFEKMLIRACIGSFQRNIPSAGADQIIYI